MALVLRLTKGLPLTWVEVDANFSGLADGTLLLTDSISTAKLADGAVNSAKLADGAVTVAKLGNGAVTSTQLANASVLAQHLADGNVTLNKLATLAADTVIGRTSSVGVPEAITVTANARAVLDDTTFANMRVTLDAAQLTSSRTEDTAPDRIADFLGSYDASAAAEKKVRLITALSAACPPGQGVLLNGKVVPSVSSNALTIAIKGDDGNDPSATNPVYVAFRSETAATGGFTVRSLTTALSVVVSSGSTLGHASGKLCHLFAYLIDNAGTVELAVSNLPPDYPGVFADTRLVTTTAEGGAGAADSATGIYSTTARSNLPWVCVAMLKSNQATAGTWATAIQQTDQAPFRIPRNVFSAARAAAQSIASATWSRLNIDTATWDPDGIVDVTTNFRVQPKVAGYYTFQAAVALDAFVAGQRFLLCFRVNGGDATYAMLNPGGASQTGNTLPFTCLMNGTTDYIELWVYQDTGGGVNTSLSFAHYHGFRVGD